MNPTDNDPGQLFALAQSGDSKASKEAMEILSYSHTGLVKALVGRWFGGNDNPHYNDMVQEGMICLMRAIMAYDPKRGKLSTLLDFYIRSEMPRRYPEVAYCVRVPPHAFINAMRINRFRGQFLQDKGREPDIIEIANHFEWDIKTAGLYAGNRDDTYEIDSALSSPYPEEYSTLRITDKALKRVDDAQTIRQLVKLADLTEQQMYLIYSKYGIGCIPLTLEEIGKNLGISRQRAKQKLDVAMHYLRIAASKAKDKDDE